MRIALATQWFPPETGTIVAAAIADGLGSRGHHVDVLTGFPNYPQGRLYSGHRLRPYVRDSRSTHVMVHRAPLYPSHNRSSTSRAANYLSFALASSIIAWTKLPRPDVWLVYSSPATASIPALLARHERKTPVCLMIQDLWPDSVTESGFLPVRVRRPIETILESFCSWTYRHATSIGVISPGMKSILVERGVDPGKIHLTMNWVPPFVSSADTEQRVALRRRLQLPQHRVFMYAGNLGELQGLEPLIQAFADVPDASLVMIGSGVSERKLRDIASEKRITNVRFVESQPPETIGQYVVASDVQVVSLRDTALLRATMPSKVQSSMAAGRPILAHAAGDVADVVSAARCGIVCRPGDSVDIIRAIRKFNSMPQGELQRMGTQARAYYEDHFSAQSGLNRLESMLEQSLSTGPRS